MTDIFFSYSSHDRQRVRPVRDALVAQGFEVFWDQQVPAGTDWDTWIRQHLTKSKCATARFRSGPCPLWVDSVEKGLVNIDES
jgi:hypothetical protein